MELPIVTTSWLQDNLQNQNLVLLDASMSKVIGKEPIIYDQPVHIPESRLIDLEDEFCDLDSSQIHAFPTVDQFTQAARKLGISAASLVVIYDNQGVYSSPRAWWICRTMGLKNVYVLDGGLPQWLAEGRAVVSEPVSISAHVSILEGAYQPAQVCNAEYLAARLESDSLTILDARSKERFMGLAPEPRPGVRSGHIPHSLNLPLAEVLDTHCYKSKEALKTLFSGLIGDASEQRLVFSCGSGITACIILLAAEIAGYGELTLYDGSWADWGSDTRLPIE